MRSQSLKILFQGDSITDGSRGRNDDPNHILGHGYPYIIAARLGRDLAATTPEFINRGISGNRVSDLYARWNEDAISLQPDVLSILAGVNDAAKIAEGLPAGATDRFERVYRHLLEETREVLPGTGLILCEPFVVQAGAQDRNWEGLIAKVTEYQHIVKQLAHEFDAVWVPLQAALDEACQVAEASYWVWDGIHPTTAGHQILADQWLAVVQNSRLAIR
ncbi:SGNH/GDSL hydrolase family protein [Paenibacillus lemnae]|uniref:SGNH/GDSL hydrolase family protein n=1 Tax=Paenibacillus lemnae TaxID=1330551 RepID=A0A848MA89_PAELE|nr:SGNH/GDSL hydrolase family protein [Paenibacillus lemnae]NMO97585.1 SGNH/GDSL hydrolase family protein [Paenibacillus lemnae]